MLKKPAKFLIAGLLSLSLSGLSACGFTPLYADKGLVQTLSHVDIVTTQNRTGYLLKQDLSKGLLEDFRNEKLYKLDIALKESRYALGLNVDNTATRYEISTAVTYSLTDIKTRKVIYKSNFVDATTYDAAESPYASMASQQDGQERAAIGISQKIQADLALYFHNANN